MFNASNVTSVRPTTGSFPVSSHTTATSSYALPKECEYGYGLGCLLRKGFNSLNHIWNRYWEQPRSSEERITQMKVEIFLSRLESFSTQLDTQLTHLEKNPRDVATMRKIEDLFTENTSFLKPHENEQLRKTQTQLLEPLQEKITRIVHSKLKKMLKDKLEQFFSESQIEGIAKRSIQQLKQFPFNVFVNNMNETTGCIVQDPYKGSGASFGRALNGEGDFDGDGKDDLLIGTPGAGTYTSSATLIKGTDLCPFPITVSALGSSSVGFIMSITASSPADNVFGWAVQIVKNLKGTNLASLVASSIVTKAVGEVFILDGTKEALSIQVNLSKSANHFMSGVQPGVLLGTAMTSGDFDGDGRMDVAIVSASQNPSEGFVSVFLGKGRGEWSFLIDPSRLGGSSGLRGFTVFVPLGDPTGYAQSLAAADIDGDGRDELFIGSAASASVWMLKGQASFPAIIRTTGLLRFKGSSGSRFGTALSNVKDMTGDNLPEIAMGAPYKLYILKSGVNWANDTNVETDLNGDNGSYYIGPGNTFGTSIIGDDFDGDGLSEVAAGSSLSNEVIVLKLKPGKWPVPLIEPSNESEGFKLQGVTKLGVALGKGDFNGDGRADLIASNGVNYVSVLFGLNPPPPGSSTSSIIKLNVPLLIGALAAKFLGEKFL